MATDPADFEKDPGEVLDYSFDWSSWLEAGETISTSTVSVSSGINLDSQSNTSTRATVVLSGGSSGVPYSIKDTITTSLSRTAVRSITIRVTPR